MAPGAGGAVNRGRRFPARPLEPEEVAALFAALHGSGWAATRDRALLAVLLRAGLRSNEARSLNPWDVRDRLPGAVVRVERPKGVNRKRAPAKARSVGLDAEAAALVRAWKHARGDGAGPLFCTRTGGKLDGSHLRRLLPRLARRAGLGRRVHPHALRHTFARDFYQERLDVVRLMHALGHRSLETTNEYLRTIGAYGDVVEAMIDRQPWRQHGGAEWARPVDGKREAG